MKKFIRTNWLQQNMLTVHFYENIISHTACNFKIINPKIPVVRVELQEDFNCKVFALQSNYDDLKIEKSNFSYKNL